LDTTIIHTPHEKYSRKELEELGYLMPIVDHKFAR